MPPVNLSPANGPRRPAAAPESPGLVLLKIDGLSYRQMQRALGAGRLPHLCRLMATGTHRTAPFYSGVPSSTPAVQAELFYGLRGSVPGVSFYDRGAGRNFNLLYPGAAGEMARRLEARGAAPLLRGGRSYSNIYAGGAEEARYCTEMMTLRSVRHLASSLKLFAVLALQPLKLLRLLGFGFLEAGLALTDFLRGLWDGRSLAKELKFIPTRVVVCILLRELIRIRVKRDLRQGVPIVHAAFLGYDEQAHRRGPASAFAHWTLRGIDAAVADIHRAARGSRKRRYRLVIYSDHGQEAVVPYAHFAGRSIQEAVGAAVQTTAAEAVAVERERGAGGAPRRPSRGLLHRQVNANERAAAGGGPAPGRIRVNAMGPLGHVYFAAPPAACVKRRVAAALVRDQQVPLVLFTDGGAVAAVNRRGRYELPADDAQVLGADHPLAEPAATDLARCCRHPLAGDLVLSGWTPVNQPLSFAVENGAHGGPGKEETRAFVLLPEELEVTPEASLRPENLRQIAIDMIGGIPG
jgi:hypothetical protein